MKKLMFIEANTTGTGMLALTKARELHVEPIFITSNPNRYRGLSDIRCTVLVCDTNKIEEIIKTIEDNLNLDEIVGITTTSEFYIKIVAQLTDFYLLSGNPVEVVNNIRNKAMVRTLTNELPSVYKPNYHNITSLSELEYVKNNIPYPCVVKPVDDSGSKGVLKCQSYEEVLGHVKYLFSQNVNIRNQSIMKSILIEEYIEGQEYSAEILSYKGKHKIIGITKKTVGNEPFFVEKGHFFPYKSKAIEDYTEGFIEILNSLNWQEGPIHLEFKIKNSKIFIVEINGRLAGGMIPELIRYSMEIDLLKEQLRVSMDKPPKLIKNGDKFAGIRFILAKHAGKVNNIQLNNESIPQIKIVKINVEQGEFIGKSTNAYERLGYFIAVSSEENELIRILNDYASEIDIDIEGE